MPIGPNGEKRPEMDEAQSAVYAMEVAMGIRQEEYAESADRPKRKSGDVQSSKTKSKG